MSTSIQQWVCDSFNATNFRTWGSGLATQLQNAGFVKTTDTGQINWATVNGSGGSNASLGYEVYHFNDTLQTSYPFYFKIEYGTGNSNNNGIQNPGMWLTFGTASNGSGTLTGQVSQRFQIAMNTATTVLTPQSAYLSYGSSGAYFVASLFDGPTYQVPMLFGFERTKDATGADNGDGLIFLSSAQSGSTRVQFVLPSSGTIPNNGTVWSVALNPVYTGSMSDGTNTTLAFPMPFGFRGYNPGLNFGVYCGTDFAYYQTISTVPAYGSNHTYKALGGGNNIAGATQTNGNNLNVAYPAMRWE